MREGTIYTGEYKLLQLRQYLSGEVLAVIENLSHSSTAYEAAKERLERKYGRRRRQIAIYPTMMTQNRIRFDFVGLRTVPVILKNGIAR